MAGSFLRRFQGRHIAPRVARIVLVLVAVLATPGSIFPQASTGTLTGRVTSDGEGLTGVTVRVSSPALQGHRAVVTRASGDYLFPGLPAGAYTVRFTLEAFRAMELEVRISAAQTRVLDAIMSLEAVEAEIEVTERYETVGMASAGAETIQQRQLEQLAVSRSLVSAVSLTAGTANTGPGNQAVVAGSQSFENLYTMNGIVLNETIRQQPSSIFIEDAVQETTVLTNGVSAEYGRFSGGVINTITRSGGDRFTGSLRIGLENDSWTAATPLTTSQVDEIRQTYEATLGGYLRRDRLWFFLAARDRTVDRSRQTHVTQIPYVQTFDDTRFEAKLTALVSQGHRVTATFSQREWPFTNGGFSEMPSMDLRSLDPLYNLENQAIALNYAGVLSDTVFAEAQFTEHEHTVIDVGGDDPSLTGGTPILDFLLAGSFHAPYFCGLPCRDEERDNRNALAKLSWFLSTDSLGTHDLVFGIDSFSDRVLYDNHQSASDYQIWTLFPHDFSTGTPLLNMMPFASLIAYRGILDPAQRTDFRTDSAYVNDMWRINNRLTLNLGLRYDANNGTDAGGAEVVTGTRWSPRFGQERISGSIDWQQMTYTISGPDLHMLDWRYVKDKSVSAGDDSGWLDMLEWSGATQPPPSGGPLAEAMDTNLSFTTDSQAQWFSQTVTSFFDGDAAQSGDVEDNQESLMGAQVSGTGTLKFYWRVSSEVGYDFLEFYIDGVLQDRISGSEDWHQMMYTITEPGAHDLEWRYVKDYSESKEEDAGWVDQVEWLGSSQPPNIGPLSGAMDTNLSFTTSGDEDWFSQTIISYFDGDAAQSGFITDNQQSSVQTIVDGAGTLSFYWKVSSEEHYDFLEFYIDGTLQDRISGTQDWHKVVFTVTEPGSHTLEWRYFKDWSESKEQDTGWVDQVEWSGAGQPPSGSTLSDAMETSFSFATGGDADWFSQTTMFYNDLDAAQSGIISHNQGSWMQTTVNGPVTVSFYWKVSSENGYDKLEFFVDGSLHDSISGSVDWREVVQTLSAGEHELKWSYVKDWSVSEGEDSGWVDLFVVD